MWVGRRACSPFILNISLSGDFICEYSRVLTFENVCKNKQKNRTPSMLAECAVPREWEELGLEVSGCTNLWVSTAGVCVL
jgi:hypothetical protein